MTVFPFVSDFLEIQKTSLVGIYFLDLLRKSKAGPPRGPPTAPGCLILIHRGSNTLPQSSPRAAPPQHRTWALQSQARASLFCKRRQPAVSVSSRVILSHTRNLMFGNYQWVHPMNTPHLFKPIWACDWECSLTLNRAKVSNCLEKYFLNQLFWIHCVSLLLPPMPSYKIQLPHVHFLRTTSHRRNTTQTVQATPINSEKFISY